jgi:glycosyltransferase involved in cell wall biosynthesis
VFREKEFVCSKPAASIILPTYNRKETLKLVLKCLENQSLPKELYEIIVSDDASSDGTQEYLSEFSQRTTSNFKYVLAEKNGGPAIARNRALKHVSGDIIIIIGDDIEVGPNFAEKHHDWHLRHSNFKDAVLGFVTWPEKIYPNSFMRWLEHGGRSFFFCYEDLEPMQIVDSQNFYTCNVSIKKAFLFETTLFDESFPFASHEDLELGERLGAVGMHLYFDNTIIGYHHHFLNIDGIAKRVYLMGYSAYLFWQKVPDRSSYFKKSVRYLLIQLASLPGVWSLLRKMLTFPDRVKGEHPIRWKVILTMSYWLGLADATRNKHVRQF